MNLDAASILATAFTQDPLVLHYHHCGRTYNGMLPGYGCGHLWSHQRDKSKSIVEDHHCPLCNKGPWYYVLSTEEIESAHSALEAIGVQQPQVEAGDSG